MRDALLLLLGAFLSVLGGFISQRNQNRLNQKKEDRELLHEAYRILVKLEPDLDDFQPSLSLEQRELSAELLIAAGKIYTKNYRDLAIKLIKFAERDGQKIKRNLFSLKEEIEKKVSIPLFKYHGAVNETFNRFFKFLTKHIEEEKKGKRKKNRDKIQQIKQKTEKLNKEKFD